VEVEGNMPTTDADDGANGTNDKQRVNLLIDSDTKSDWKAYAEQSDQHTSLSQLIRFAVSQEMRDEHGSAQGGTDDELREAVYDLVDSNRRIESRFDDVDDRLKAVESAVSEPPDELKDLMGDVFDALPTENEATWRHDTTGMPDTDGDYQGPDTGRIEDVADHLDEQSYRVRRAIEQIQNENSLVESTVVDGDDRYYRRS
jgi:hypothetical protein